MKEYFPHDYNARTDPKLQEVMMSLGVAGIGVYWCLVEQLYEQGGSLPVESMKSIAFTLHTEVSMVESLVNDFKLFETDGVSFWSNSIKKRFEKRSIISDVRSEAGRLGAMKRWQKDSKRIANAIEEIANANENDGKKWQRKEKEREKEYKRKEYSTSILKEKKEREDLPLSAAIASDPTKSKSIDYRRLMEFFNAKADGRLPLIQTMTENRKGSIRARVAEYGKEALMAVIEKAVESSFLVGNNNKNWRADFDWIMRPTNFVKILEGVYDNKPEGAGQTARPQPSGANGLRRFFDSDVEEYDNEI